MKNKICKNRYTHSDKIKALRILESNCFNYLLTYKQTSISRQTLKNWEKLYGKEVFKGKSPTEEALVEIDSEIKEYDINIIRKLYTIRRQVIDRVLLIAGKETRLESLVNVLKYISIELQKYSETEKPGYDPTVDYIALVVQGLKDSEKYQSQLENQDISKI